MNNESNNSPCMNRNNVSINSDDVKGINSTLCDQETQNLYETIVENVKQTNENNMTGTEDKFMPYNLDTVYSSIPIGFKNPQLYCYLNSVMQMLYSCDKFRKCLISVNKIDIEKIEEFKTDVKFVIDLGSLFIALQETNNDLVQERVLVVQKYYQNGKYGDDIHKCFLNTLKFVSYGLRAISKLFKESNEAFEACDLFKTECTFCSLCLNCENELYNRSQIFLSFPLTVPDQKEISLDKCVKMFGASSPLEMSLVNCCSKPNYESQFNIETLSKYIFIYLMRGNNYGLESKIDTLVTIDDGIILEKKGGSTCFYRVKLVIEHIGTAQHGHYYVKSLVKGKWWRISDYHKEKINESEVLSKNIVGIFLELIDTGENDVDIKMADNIDNISSLENSSDHNENSATKKEDEDDDKIGAVLSVVDDDQSLSKNEDKKEDALISSEEIEQPIVGKLVLNDQYIPDSDSLGILGTSFINDYLKIPIISIMTLSLCLKDLWLAISDHRKNSQKGSQLIYDMLEIYEEIDSASRFPKFESSVIHLQRLFDEASWSTVFYTYMDLCMSAIKEQNENSDIIDSEYVKEQTCSKCNESGQEIIKRRLVSLSVPKSDYGQLEDMVKNGFKSEQKKCVKCDSMIDSKLILNKSGKYVFIELDRDTTESWNNCSIYPEEAYFIPVGKSVKLFALVAVMDLVTNEERKMDYIIKSFHGDKWVKVRHINSMELIDDFEIITNRSILLVLQSIE